MKKLFAYFTGIGSAIFLFTERAVAAVANSGLAQAMQLKYGPPNIQAEYAAQALYGAQIVNPNFALMTFYEKIILSLKNPADNPIVWAIILVPIIFIIGLIVAISKWRKNKKKADAKKNSQNRRA